jgi:hypothetical protein
MYGNEAMVKILLEKTGVDVNLKDNRAGCH